ncbi:RES domain-containing protein [Morganella psychrotolerans]|uniref:RES family NAD+ phosphorylase n=1 Tax=Morganella psychrotolerans TaxID=368603 RepID=A0A5M9R0P1_9GAMM|nr:RES domain-containing protein [Morganella psychrotolerans]KAA8714170.1 RES family NAD+ phosphorylase [Morganella psychrotolerans]
MSLCCISCFHDVVIRDFIGKDHGNGRCGHCQTTDIFTIDAEKLSQFFEPFLGLVEESDGGNSLSNILQSLFHMFNNQVENKDRLIAHILGEEYRDKKYKLKYHYQEHLDGWEEFKNEIKHKNRFFPEKSMYSSLFDIKDDDFDGDFFDMIEQLKIDYHEEDKFYRARINESLLTKDEMGMPPKEYASAGRANPIGIPYLYLSNNKSTCIAEVRPNNTSKIHISEFTLLKNVSLIDLTNPRKKMSICKFEEGHYNNVISILNLIEALSRELSIPVRPESSNIDYIPTQFLCEFLKSFSKCDGIIFESSFGSGLNFVFFLEVDFTVSNPIIHRVTRITHEYNP